MSIDINKIAQEKIAEMEKNGEIKKASWRKASEVNTWFGIFSSKRIWCTEKNQRKNRKSNSTLSWRFGFYGI